MLKIYDKEGNLRYVFRDEDKLPVEAKKYAKELLERYNIKMVDTEEIDDEITVDGISQDDLKHLDANKE